MERADALGVGVASDDGEAPREGDRQRQADIAESDDADVFAHGGIIALSDYNGGMLIAQLIPRLDGGGAERGTVELNREFVRRGESGVVVSAGGRQAAQIVRDGGRHMTLPIAGKNPLSAPFRAAQLARFLRALNPDIVHVRSRVPAWLHKMGGGRKRFATVATMHGFNRVNFYSAIMADADAVICAGTAIAAHAKRAYGVAPERIALIPRGVDCDYFDPAKVSEEEVAGLRREFGLVGRRVILHMGRIVAGKGHDVFIRGIARLRRWDGEVAGMILGGGDEEKLGALRALAEELGVADDVVFAGERPDARAFYGLAEVVASCSLRPETFGRTMAEALAMNVPVAASATGGALDIVRERAHGRLFPPGDVDAFADATMELLAAEAPNSRSWVESEFSLEKMTEANLALYRKVLAARRG